MSWKDSSAGLRVDSFLPISHCKCKHICQRFFCFFVFFMCQTYSHKLAQAEGPHKRVGIKQELIKTKFKTDQSMIMQGEYQLYDGRESEYMSHLI